MSDEKVVRLDPSAPDHVVDFEQPDGFAQHFMRLAGQMAAAFPGDLCGVVIVGVNQDGHWATGWRVRKDSPIKQTMLAGLAVAAVTRDMLADAATCDALVRNGLASPPDDQA